MTVDLKKLSAVIGILVGIIVPIYGGYKWVGTWIVTKSDFEQQAQQRTIATLNLLIESQKNRITMYTLHGDDLTPEQQGELEGLKNALALNECEAKKAIGMFSANHKCGG